MSDEGIPSAQSALNMSTTKTTQSILANRLVLATTIPPLEETITLLELNLERPSAGRYYDFGSLLNINRLLPEYQEFWVLQSGPGSVLPTKIGDILLESILLDETEYINPILDLAGKAGYRTAWVLKSGIVFFVHLDQMGNQSRLFYQNFFLPRKVIYQQIKDLIIQLIGGEFNQSRKLEILELKILGKTLNHICLKYPHCFSKNAIQLINYEMTIHYRKMNFSSFICSDSNQLKPHDLETPIEPTTLKIFFQLNRIIDKLFDQSFE